jgi:hypothetical protein
MTSPSDSSATAGGPTPVAGFPGTPVAGDFNASRGGIKDSGIGASPVGGVGIIIVAAIVLTALVLAVYCLIAVWPPSGTGAATAPSHVFGFRITLDRDQQLFVIVGLAGVLGGLIHSVRSLYWYAGNRVLLRSWLLMYVCLPAVGGALALVFYLILRAACSQARPPQRKSISSASPPFLLWSACSRLKLPRSCGKFSAPCLHQRCQGETG